ncbi:MAG TPA: M14 family zinc carboxypeptidase [Candidatus Eisenbacteria bacterium]|nr:M14 family zinc carboxypeptidase [Candidatus Eisenbacteria bacterium]
MSVHALKNPGRCLRIAALAVALTAASTAAGRVAAAELPAGDPAIPPRLVEVSLGAMPLETFLEAGLDVIEVRGASRVRILEWPGDEATLARLGLATTLIDADPGATAAARARAELAARPAPQGRRVMSATGPDGSYRIQILPPFGSGSMGGYWTLAEVKTKLDELVANDTQDLVAIKIDTLGTTVQGRPIWGLRIAKAVVGPDTRPVVFYNALTHAREPEGMQALFYFVDDLLGKYGTDPTATYLLENRVIYIVPVVNPDGYMRNQTTNPGGGGLWRKNLRDNDASGTVTSSDGVDINRNYGFQWGFDNSGSSGSQGSATYRGPSAFSEAETQAQRNIVVALQPKTGLSFHTYGDLLLHPWGYTVGAPPDSNAFYEWEDDMTLGNGYTSGQGIRVLYSVNGEFNDWTYGDTGLKPRAYTWTPEIGGPNDGFWPAPSRIVPLAEENLRVAYYAASIAGPFVRVERSSVLNGPLTAASSHWVAVRARNKGITGSAGPGLIGTMSSLSAGASVVSGPVAYPTLGSMASADASDGAMFLVAVDDTVTAGRLLRLRMDFSAPGGFFSRDTVELVCGVPTVLATESASGTLAAWTVIGGWGIVSNDPVHPSRYVADSPSGTYAGSDTTNMLTRNGTLNLSSGVHAYAFYDARWQFESDFDCGVLEASLNGTTWLPVRATGSSLGRSGGVQPVGQPVYDGARYLWREERADLSPFTGPAATAVRLRFRIRSDGGSELDGLNFDSLRVMVYDPAQQPSPVAVGDGDRPVFLALAPPAPNPVRDAALFSFSLPASGEVRLELFDLMGRHVRTLAAASLPAGRYVRGWDGRDEAGRPTPAGVYLARLSGAAGTVSRRFVVLN